MQQMMFTNLGLEQLRRAVCGDPEGKQGCEARHTARDLLSLILQQVGDLSTQAVFEQQKALATESLDLSCQSTQEVAGVLSKMLLTIIQLADILQVDLGKAALQQLAEQPARYKQCSSTNPYDTLKRDQQQTYTVPEYSTQVLNSCSGHQSTVNSSSPLKSPQTTAGFICNLSANSQLTPVPNSPSSSFDLSRGLITAPPPNAALQATAAGADASFDSPFNNSKHISALVPGSGAVSPSHHMQQQQPESSSPFHANSSRTTKLVSSPELVSASDEVLVRQESGFLPKAAVERQGSMSAFTSNHVTVGAASTSTSDANTLFTRRASMGGGSPVHQAAGSSCIMKSHSADAALGDAELAAAVAAAANLSGSPELAAALSSSAEAVWLGASPAPVDVQAAAIAAVDANNVARALLDDSSNNPMFNGQLSISAQNGVAYEGGYNRLGSGVLLDAMVTAAQGNQLLPTAAAHTNGNAHAAAAAALSPAFVNQQNEALSFSAWGTGGNTGGFGSSSCAALSPAQSLGFLLNPLDSAAAVLQPVTSTVPMSPMMAQAASGPVPISSSNGLMMLQAAAAAAGLSPGVFSEPGGLSSPVEYVNIGALSHAAATAVDVCTRCGVRHNGRCHPKAKCPRCYRRAHSGKCWPRCIYCNLVHEPGNCNPQQ